jgi:acetyltransferase-like isoleucine patch superfamily enzyme
MKKNIYKIFIPTIILNIIKHKAFLIKHKNRIIIDEYSLMIDKKAEILCHGKSHIKMGKKLCIKNNVLIEVHDNAIIEIGDNVFINRNSSIVARYGIKIGNNSMIGEMVNVYDHDHVYGKEDKPFSETGYKGKEIIIGNNVWIGSGVFIRRGVSIGDNVVIGAKTTVTKNIPSNVVVYSENKLVIKEIENNDK